MRFSHLSFTAIALARATPALADPLPVTSPLPVPPVAAAPGTLGSTSADAVDAPVDAPAAAMADAATAPKAFTITGGATLVSDYRFRGLSQTNGGPALQATLNVNHSSGFYVGTWASQIDGALDGSTPALVGYGHAEVDLYAGFTRSLKSGVGVDVGLLYYYYPGRATGVKTDFFEPYASLNYTLGPVNAKVGAAYAWGGQPGLNFTSGSNDNLYVYGELAGGVPRTPFTLKGHLGHTSGSLGLANPSLADDKYWDWSVTLEAISGPAKVGVSYVDTDITESTLGNTYPKGFARTFGRGATVLAYVGFSF